MNKLEEMSDEEKKEYYEKLGFKEGKIHREKEKKGEVPVIGEDKEENDEGLEKEELEQYREVSGL